MASYNIRWKQSASKELKRLDRMMIPRVLAAVEALAAEPQPPDCEITLVSQKTLTGMTFFAGRHNEVFSNKRSGDQHLKPLSGLFSDALGKHDFYRGMLGQVDRGLRNKDAMFINRGDRVVGHFKSSGRKEAGIFFSCTECSMEPAQNTGNPQ